MSFIATSYRVAAKLSLQTIISQDYPQQAPVFVLRVQWKKERTAMNDENIRVSRSGGGSATLIVFFCFVIIVFLQCITL